MPASLYLCIHVCDFAAQALTSPTKHVSPAMAVLSGTPPLEQVFAMNASAREQGLELGMSRVQAESFSIVLLRRDCACEDAVFAKLMICAERFSPKIESIAMPQEETCGATLVLDVTGSERLFGSAQVIATTVHHAVHTIGLEANVATSHNAYTALLAARGFAGALAIATGDEASTLAPLPLTVLELDSEQAETFTTWGIHTLGQLAALPTKALAARLGPRGIRMQDEARGTASHLLVPEAAPAAAPICKNLELDHPVELLEPLLFLLSQMLEQILQHASERSLAIASVETCLWLEHSTLSIACPEEDAIYEHRRIVRPTIPERDRMTLLKLIQLDLERHPPEAAVIAIRLTAYPARRPVSQQGLFAAQTPEAGRMEILLSRLRKLVGEDRVGAPELLDTHGPEDFRVSAFNIADISCPVSEALLANHASALRMVRPPHAIHVELCGEVPAVMHYEGERRRVQASSGPWRSNGAWWTHPAWCREEWDVVLQEESHRCLRLAHDPSASCWYVIGIYD